jgi:hypothetical protein
MNLETLESKRRQRNKNQMHLSASFLLLEKGQLTIGQLNVLYA